MLGLGLGLDYINYSGETVAPPIFTVNPQITGTAVVNQTLTCDGGTVTGGGVITKTYQWYRGATLISGATNSTYTLVQDDAGQNIKCTVTATNSAGSASADSNTVAILATLLDLYPNAAAAYSVRLLRGAYYGSPAIRVRRSSDNAEQDIGFTTSGDLNTSALTTFVGSNSGFIVTWYDQSGNGENETQTTANKQARIVNAGAIEIINTKPALRFDGTNTSYINTTIGATTSKSVYFVKKGESFSGASSVLGFPTTITSTQLGLYYLNTSPFPYGVNTWNSDTFGYNSGNTDFLSQTIEMCLLINGAPQTSEVKLFVNNVQKVLTQLRGTSVSRTMANGFRIGMGGDETSHQNYDGFFQEIIVYNGDNSTTDRSAITTNQNTYYGVY